MTREPNTTAGTQSDAYRLNANYYRLGHELVAQTANETVRRKINPSVLAAAVAEGETVLDDARAVLSDFEDREAGDAWFWWFNRKALSGPERRLQEFLAATVEPSLQLALLGLSLPTLGAAQTLEGWRAFRDREPRRFRRFPRRLSRRPWRPDVGLIGWSYRSFYNLACLQAMIVGASSNVEMEPLSSLAPAAGLPAPLDGKHIDVAVVLWALEQALRRAHGARRTWLVDRAASDPTLMVMRARNMTDQTRRQVVALLDRYRLPPTEASGDDEVATAIASPGLGSAELAALMTVSTEQGWSDELRGKVVAQAAAAGIAAGKLDEPGMWQSLAQVAKAAAEPGASPPTP